MKLILERLENNDFPLPQFATEGSVALDFKCCVKRLNNISQPEEPKLPIDFEFINDGSILFKSGTFIMMPLGWKVQITNTELDLYIQIHTRSSMGSKAIVLANGTGIIDASYRGEIMAPLYNRSKTDYIISHGDRIVQGIIKQYFTPIAVEGKVDNTIRGEGGFGSTGR